MRFTGIIVVSLVQFFLVVSLAFAQTDYGKIFEDLEDKANARSDDEIFNSILPKLNSQQVSQNICNDYSSLIDKGHIETIRFLLRDMTSRRKVTNRCNFKVDSSILCLASDLYPEMRKSGEDMLLNYYSLNNFGSFCSRDVSQIIAKQNEYLKRAADLDHPKAQFLYGNAMLKEGEKKEAFIYFNKAAENGRSDAKLKLKSEYNYDFASDKKSEAAPKDKENTKRVSGIQTFDTILDKSENANQPVQTTRTSSFEAKNYWTNKESVLVYDNNGDHIETLSFASEVTVYGAKNGKRKIDLVEEKWVDNNSLTETKPVATSSLTEPKPILNSLPMSNGSTSINSGITTRQNAEKGDSLTLQNDPHFIRYVASNTLNERDAPNGKVVNKQYRGQLLRVYGSAGKWFRVSPKFASPRYVHSDYLSETKPKPVTGGIRFMFSDSRIESSALPNAAGQYGLNKYDVETIWLAARHALDKGICKKIIDADKSVSKTGKYYLNCGGPKNNFFSRSGSIVTFDGHSSAKSTPKKSKTKYNCSSKNDCLRQCSYTAMERWVNGSNANKACNAFGNNDRIYIKYYNQELMMRAFNRGR